MTENRFTYARKKVHFLQWKRELPLALGTALAVIAIAVWGSDAGLTDALLAAAATFVATFIVMPLLEFLWHFWDAPFQMMQELRGELARAGGPLDPAEPSAPAPHPHASLIARLDALTASVEGEEGMNAIPWAIAHTFNILLDEAKQSTHAGPLEAISIFERSGVSDMYAGSGDLSVLRSQTAQIKAIVEHAQGGSWTGLPAVGPSR